MEVVLKHNRGTRHVNKIKNHPEVKHECASPNGDLNFWTFNFNMETVKYLTQQAENVKENPEMFYPRLFQLTQGYDLTGMDEKVVFIDKEQTVTQAVAMLADNDFRALAVACSTNPNVAHETFTIHDALLFRFYGTLQVSQNWYFDTMNIKDWKLFLKEYERLQSANGYLCLSTTSVYELTDVLIERPSTVIALQACDTSIHTSSMLDINKLLQFMVVSASTSETPGMMDQKIESFYKKKNNETPRITPTMDIDQVLGLYIASKLQTLPVVVDNKLVGVFGFKEVKEAVLIKNWDGQVHNLLKSCNSFQNVRKNHVIVSDQTLLIDATKEMIKDRNDRVFIVDNNNEFLGSLCAADVLDLVVLVPEKKFRAQQQHFVSERKEKHPDCCIDYEI